MSCPTFKQDKRIFHMCNEISMHQENKNIEVMELHILQLQIKDYCVPYGKSSCIPALIGLSLPYIPQPILRKTMIGLSPLYIPQPILRIAAGTTTVSIAQTG